MSWASWPKLQAWHSRHLDSLKLLNGGKPNNNNNKFDKSDRADDSVLGVSTDFLKKSKLCIKFQSEICDLESGHMLGKTALSLTCGYCLSKSRVVADHLTKSCPEKAKVFHRGGGR